MSYQAHPSQPAIKCDAPSCKRSSDDYPNSKIISRGRHRLIRMVLTDNKWVCALGLDLCPEHSDARYDHDHSGGVAGF